MGESSTQHATPGLTVLIPAYNEEETIGPLVRRIREIGPEWEILVVDDGSADQTAQRAEEAGARVVRHLTNRGNGAAVKTGMRAATHDYVVIIDADGQHPPEDIPRLAEQLATNDLVVGARTRASDSEWARNVGNLFMRKLASYLIGHHIPDLTSGFRAFDRHKIAEFIHLYPDGFSFPTTSTLCQLASGRQVAFVPIVGRRRPPTTKSKIKLWRDGMRFLRLIMRVVIMFNPMKIFWIVGGLPFVAGVGWMCYRAIAAHQLSLGGAMLGIIGLMLIFFGLLLDQISTVRREMHMLVGRVLESTDALRQS